MAERPIVVGVDGTTAALRAVAWAAAEARMRHRPLRILHAAPYLGTVGSHGPTRGRADAVLARARAVAHHVGPDVAIDTAAVLRSPVSTLVDASADAELLVIGMIGGVGAEIVLGSPAFDVTAGAHCPVAVVRFDGAAGAGRDAPVVLGIESVDADAAAVTVAFDDADRHGTGVVVVYVPSHPHDLGDAAAAVRERLAPWRSEHPDVGVDIRVGQGNAGVALLHESAAARHIVLGSRGRHAVSRAVLGSVSRFVLRHSPVPVTVVPRAAPSDADRAREGHHRGSPAPEPADVPLELRRSDERS